MRTSPHALDVDVAYAAAGKAVDKLFIAFHPCLILQSGVGFEGLHSNHTVGRVSAATHCKTRGAAGLAVEQGEIVTTSLDTAPVDGKDDVARSQTGFGCRQRATGQNPLDAQSVESVVISSPKQKNQPQQL